MSKVKMELPNGAVDAEAPEQKKQEYSYDDLLQIAKSLSTSNVELQRRLNDAMLSNFFTRLEFLFKVVKFADKFPDDFVKKTIEEIITDMSFEEDKSKDAE